MGTDSICRRTIAAGFLLFLVTVESRGCPGATALDRYNNRQEALLGIH
jgi:hypothetical protein